MPDLHELEQKNWQLVEEAKRMFSEHLWQNAIDQFMQSREICQEQRWPAGVEYAEKMIKQSWGAQNEQLVNDAKKALQANDPHRAILLYNQSMRICASQNWPEGVQFAKEQILLAERLLSQSSSVPKVSKTTKSRKK